jgi:TRAP-type C4-dicarboxylate transport system permease large subunit
MNKIISIFVTIFIFSLSSCQAIGDIFKAGVWVGALIVIGVIALIIYFVKRGSGKD